MQHTGKRILSAILLAILLVSASLPAFAAEEAQDGNRYIVNATITVRSGPGGSYGRLGKLQKGDVVMGTETLGSWVKFTYNGKTAYVTSSGLTPAADTSTGAEESVAYVLQLSPMMTKAGNKGTRVCYLSPGTRVEILETAGSSTLVAVEGKSGYVASGNIAEVTGTGAVAFKKAASWYYAGNANVITYRAPTASAKYRDEIPFGSYSRIFVIAVNGRWAQVYTSYGARYVQMDKLYTSPVQGPAVSTTGKFASGATARVQSGGAATYSTTNSAAYVSMLEEKAYGKIAAGTEVTIAYCTSKLAYVLWQDDRTNADGELSHAGFVHMAFIPIASIA